MIRKKYIKRIYRSVAEVLHDVVGWVLVLFLLRRKDNGSSTSMSLSRLGVQVKLLLDPLMFVSQNMLPSWSNMNIKNIKCKLLIITINVN